MNNKVGLISLIVAIIALVGGVSIGVLNHYQHKQGYIVVKKVFDEFEMSKQYKKKLESVQMARKGIIDSLQLTLKAQARAINAGKEKSKDRINQFELDKQYYIEKSKQVKEDNEALIKQYNEDVIKQMNQYVKDYGEKNGYEFLFGGDGSGALMYGNSKLDITDDVIKYINDRYKGNNK